MREVDAAKVAAYRGTSTSAAQPMTEPITVEPDILLSRSLRLPEPMFDALTALAAQRGQPWSHIVRDWIAEGLAREAAGVDPVVELRQVVALVTDVARRLEQRAA
jgi:hypothetical protein